MLDTLKQLLSSAVTAAGYEFVGFEDVLSDRRHILRVYIDSESGVNIDDCAKASRQIGAVLDVEDTMMGRYSLEVSSPGVNRLLFEPEQYQKFMGEMVQVKLRTPKDKRKNFKGVLEQINADTIVVRVDGTCYELAFNNIAKANVVLDAVK